MICFSPFMSAITNLGSVTCLACIAIGCSSAKAPLSPVPPAPIPSSSAPSDSSSASSAPAAEKNPLLASWSGDFGGLPPFANVREAHFEPALEQAMTEALQQVDKIANQTDPPTFANTIVALEQATPTFDRVTTVYGVWSTSIQTPAFQRVEQTLAPKLAAFDDKIKLNAKLFERIDTVYAARDSSGLTDEQKRLAWKYYDSFVRAGAKLNPTEKARMAEINEKLASLFTKFSQNVVADEADQFIALDNEKDLAGLPETLRQSAATEAASRKMPGKWVISNTRSAVQPFLTYADRRDLREKVWRMFVNRGATKGPTNNYAIITEILQLRAEQAKLLGYETFAHLRLANTMAKTPKNAVDLLERVWKPAVQRVREEVADMQAVANREKANIKIEPWDYYYYAEKVRKQKYNLDENEIKPYLQLNNLRQAMFWVAGELYSLQFEPLSGVEVFHPDVTVYKVIDKTSSKPVGIYYFDPYARKGKNSGAWMDSLRQQENISSAVLPIVSNNCNFIKPASSDPALISWDDATTLFHEFGHALHGILSDVQYPSLSGTAVFRDYVEFPSQLMEHWLSTPEVLNKFALHYETKKTLPEELIKRINKAATFNSGFSTVEYLASALVDMKIHLQGSKKIDPEAFERDTLKQIGMPAQIVMRHRSPHFKHVFASNSYAAGYYSYLWADVLTADAFEAFEEAKGPYDLEVAGKLRKFVLSKGNTVDPADGYRAFRSRDPRVQALMKKRGFRSN